jgi:hypothetical protein
MIIRDFDVLSARISPSETDPELVIDPDAVLSFPVALKSFQTISGRDAKVIQPPGDFQLPKLTPGHSGKIGKTLYRIALGQGLRIGTAEGLDHGLIITRYDNNVKRFYPDACSTRFAEAFGCLPKGRIAKGGLNDQSTRSPSRKKASSREARFEEVTQGRPWATRRQAIATAKIIHAAGSQFVFVWHFGKTQPGY